MTDFFADLEQEIRAAHPRRSRPVVPVRGIAVTAAVAATLVAVVLALGQLSTGAEEEVAQQPPPPGQGWTEDPARDCAETGRVIEGPVPDEMVDAFGIIRSSPYDVALSREEVPGPSAVVFAESARPVRGGRTGQRFVFAVVALLDERCRPTSPIACLISVETEDEVCADPAQARPMLTWIAEESGTVVVLAEDAVQKVQIRAGQELIEVEMEDNLAFAQISDPGEVAVDAVTP